MRKIPSQIVASETIGWHRKNPWTTLQLKHFRVSYSIDNNSHNNSINWVCALIIRKSCQSLVVQIVLCQFLPAFHWDTHTHQIALILKQLLNEINLNWVIFREISTYARSRIKLYRTKPIVTQIALITTNCNSLRRKREWSSQGLHACVFGQQCVRLTT